MSLSALKRRLIPGTLVRVEENTYQDTAGHVRIVVRTQTNGLAWEPSEWTDEQRARYGVAWLYWPKRAALVTYDGADEFTVRFEDDDTNFVRYRIDPPIYVPGPGTEGVLYGLAWRHGHDGTPPPWNPDGLDADDRRTWDTGVAGGRMAARRALIMAGDSPSGAPDWRSVGAKRRGQGWFLTSPARARYWMLAIGKVEWTTETFWRVGICDEQRAGIPVESRHERFPTEAAAFAGVATIRSALEART